MDIVAFFSSLFANIYQFLNRPINFGNFETSLFGVFIGITLIGLVVSVVRKLYD